jgi:hypothetical protein
LQWCLLVNDRELRRHKLQRVGDRFVPESTAEFRRLSEVTVAEDTAEVEAAVSGLFDQITADFVFGLVVDVVRNVGVLPLFSVLLLFLGAIVDGRIVSNPLSGRAQPHAEGSTDLVCVAVLSW